jgi:polyhydroxybutyrate depolymerase
VKRLLLALPVLLLLVLVLATAAVLLNRRYRLEPAPITAGPVSVNTGTYEVEIESGGRRRTYLLHVPPGLDGAPRALVIALHGGGGRAKQMDDLTHFTSIADREGFLLAFPDGVDKNWNDGRPDVGSKAQQENVDDVGFISALIDDVAAKLPLDPARVYATGISNGAIMSTRLACELAGRIAAVGLVVGTAPQGFESTCAPGRPVPVIAFLSRDDPLVPFEGGEVTGFFGLVKRGKVVGMRELQDFWLRNNGCPSPPTTEQLPDVTTSDNSTVTRDTARGCAGGGDVVFYILDGAGHTWPGGKQYLTPWLVGTTDRDIDASELIWQFFAAHPKP